MIVTQALIRNKLNVLEKAGKQGTNLIIDYLFGWKGSTEISRDLRASGFRTTDSNVRKHLDKYKADYEKKKPRGTELITNHMVKTRMLEIQQEFQKAVIADPIQVLHKNIYELEQLKNKNNDIRTVGSILELQSKFATNLAKLQPPKDVKININQLLERNDLGVNFIIQMDTLHKPDKNGNCEECKTSHPGLDLKVKFLEFVQANSDEV